MNSLWESSYSSFSGEGDMQEDQPCEQCDDGSTVGYYGNTEGISDLAACQVIKEDFSRRGRSWRSESSLKNRVLENVSEERMIVESGSWGETSG